MYTGEQPASLAPLISSQNSTVNLDLLKKGQIWFVGNKFAAKENILHPNLKWAEGRFL